MQGCPYNVAEMCTGAASGGSVCVIEHLKQHFGAVIMHPVVLKLMLQTAGAYDELDAAQWLHAQGAEWPDVLHFGNIDAHTVPVWHGETLGVGTQ
jgi:hypothetical protein